MFLRITFLELESKRNVLKIIKKGFIRVGDVDDIIEEQNFTELRDDPRIKMHLIQINDRIAPKFIT